MSEYNDRLTEISARASSASSPPWEATYGFNNGGCATGFFKMPQHISGAEVEMLVGDAFFCAHAREDVPWLLEQLRAASDVLTAAGIPDDGRSPAERVQELAARHDGAKEAGAKSQEAATFEVELPAKLSAESQARLAAGYRYRPGSRHAMPVSTEDDKLPEPQAGGLGLTLADAVAKYPEATVKAIEADQADIQAMKAKLEERRDEAKDAIRKVIIITSQNNNQPRVLLLGSSVELVRNRRALADMRLPENVADATSIADDAVDALCKAIDRPPVCGMRMDRDIQTLNDAWRLDVAPHLQDEVDAHRETQAKLAEAEAEIGRLRILAVAETLRAH